MAVVPTERLSAFHPVAQPMGLIAEFRLTSDQLALVDVATGVPEATVEFEAVQGRPSGPPAFVVQTTGADAKDIDQAFADAESVTDHSFVVADGETSQYRCFPTGGPPEDLELLAENKSVPDRVTITPDGWEERRWFADRAEFDEFRSFCHANDYDFRLHRLVEVDSDAAGDAADGADAAHADAPGPFGTTDGDSARPPGMTEAQHEALVTAHKMGYFDVPRTASTADVADELDIAAASASERLRRAQNHLVDQFRRADDRIKPRID